MAERFPRTASPGQDNASDEHGFHTPPTCDDRERDSVPIHRRLDDVLAQRQSETIAYSATGTGSGRNPSQDNSNGDQNVDHNRLNSRHAENVRNAENAENPRYVENAENAGDRLPNQFQNNVHRQQAPDRNYVPTMNDLFNLLQHSLRPQRPVNPHIAHHDLEYVIPNRGSQINITRDCPESLSDRRLWLKTVEVLFENSQSGIRWIEQNSVLACKHTMHAQNIFTSNFSFDLVIPLSHIFRVVDGNLFLEQPDVDGNMLFIQIADRILREISRKVYALLLVRIPESSQHLMESVKSYDGLALIKCLRSQTDNIHQTLVESLRDRKSALSLPSLADWPKTKSDLVSLYKDWQQAVLDGAIDVGDSLTENSFKHLVADICDTALPGTYEWVHSVDNGRKSWRDCLDHCDMLCRAQAKRLLSRRHAEAHGMLAADLDHAEEPSDDTDAASHSHYNYRRRYTPPSRENQRYPHAGRGAGIVRDTWRGGWSGYAARGKGAARGRGRGRGRGTSYMQRDSGAYSKGRNKKPRTGKLMTFDEWTEAFRSFQDSQSSHSHAAITPHATDTHTPPNETSASAGDSHAAEHDDVEGDESVHESDEHVDESRFQ